MKTLSIFWHFANFHGVLRHHGAYSSSWRVRRSLGAGFPLDPLLKNALIATWEFPSTSWGSQVFIQSPSHSTRNSMLPCSSDRLCLMDFTPHSLSFALDFIRCFCKHIAVSVNTHYQDRIINMFHHSQTVAKFKLFQWKSQWEPCTSIQVCMCDSPLASFQAIPETAVRSVRDAFLFYLVHRNQHRDKDTNSIQIVSSDFGTLVLLKYASWPDGL